MAPRKPTTLQLLLGKFTIFFFYAVLNLKKKNSKRRTRPRTFAVFVVSDPVRRKIK